MILAIIQARMGSSRLPGKVMKPILGTPMLFLQIERIKRARLLNAIVVATTTDEADDILANECVRRDVAVHRGSVSDVLNRYIETARDYEPKAIVRLTGDCPLTDWTVIDLVVRTYKNGRFLYVSNINPPTYPDGLDVEVIDYEALRIADAEARLSSEREHVTPYIRKYPERFLAANVSAPIDLSGLRWTVDEPEDFELVRTIYEGLYPSDRVFGTAAILDYLKLHPELMRLNKNIVRNVGLRKSEAMDKGFSSL